MNISRLSKLAKIIMFFLFIVNILPNSVAAAEKKKPDLTVRQQVFEYNCEGNSYERLKQYDKAVAEYNKAMELDPENSDAYLNRGNVYYAQNQYDLAIADYSKAIELNSKSIEAYSNRGKIYSALKEYSLSGNDDRKTTSLNLAKFTHKEKSKEYLKLKQYDLAIDEYNKVIEFNTRDAYAYNGRGLVYYEQRYYDSALDDYNRALRLDPGNAYAYNNRGRVYYELREFDLAIADYNKALEYDPNHEHAYNNLAIIYDERKQDELALAWYTKAIELNPNYTSAYNNRGYFYYERKQYDLAIADYNKALEIDPQFKLAFSNRAIAETASKVKTEADNKARRLRLLGLLLGAVIVGGSLAWVFFKNPPKRSWRVVMLTCSVLGIAVTLIFMPSFTPQTPEHEGQNTKLHQVPKLAQLRSQGINIIEDKIIPLKLADWGNVNLVSGTITQRKRKSLLEIGEINYLRLYLTDSKSNILYDFPVQFTNSRLKEAALVDVNGLEALVLIINKNNKNNKKSGQSDSCEIYFPRGKEFVRLIDIEKKITVANISEKNISNVTVLLKNTEIDKKMIESAEPMKIFPEEQKTVSQAKTLEELRQKHLEIDEDHSFEIELENWGKVKFVPVKGYYSSPPYQRNKRLGFYLVDAQGNILYELPDFHNDHGWTSGVLAVTFVDINHDGMKDIVIITANYSKKGELFPGYATFFRTGREFVNIAEVDQVIDDELIFKPAMKSDSNRKEANIDNLLDFISSLNLDENIAKSIKTLADLESQGFRINKEQSFPVDLENWGPVRFISVTKKFWPEMKPSFPIIRTRFYLMDDQENILYEFPVDYHSDASFIKELAWADVNKDGLKDLIVLFDGKDNSPRIYCQKGKEFVNMNSLAYGGNPLDNFFESPYLREHNVMKTRTSADQVLKFYKDKRYGE